MATAFAFLSMIINYNKIEYDDNLQNAITCDSDEDKQVISIRKGVYKNTNFWLSATLGAMALGLGEQQYTTLEKLPAQVLLRV